ncbi:Low affinity immunoglobulin epsilon Fc [Mactra antiquata]
MFQYVDIERQWAVAQESCAGNGGRLLQVDTDEKWNYWKSIEHPFTDAITYWIGLNDIESEGNFVWTDGTLTPSKTVDMFTNKFHDFMNLEDCCEIANFKWNDNVCAKFFSSVCEYGWA